MHMRSPSRRQLLAGSAALTTTAAVRPARAQDGDLYTPPAVPMADGAAAIGPDDALQLLREGNEAFVAERLAPPDLSRERRALLSDGQAPFATVVACSDSRVPPELLFGRGLGELFIIRNAGNTLDTVAMGSVEFSVAVLRVPLVVVLGHESCGAVKAAMSVVSDNARFPGAIGRMVEPIIPAALKARADEGDPTENAIRQNVRRVVRDLREDSEPMVLEPQKTGALKVVGAYYDLDGTVDFFDRA